MFSKVIDDYVARRTCRDSYLGIPIINSLTNLSDVLV